MQGDGHTALTLAASQGHMETVHTLLLHGADMEATSAVM